MARRTRRRFQRNRYSAQGRRFKYLLWQMSGQSKTSICQSERIKVTSIIGPSGCGKSTFIRCLNRMHEVTPGGRVQGKVLLDGQDLYGPGVDPVDVRRRVGMVFQKPNVFPSMSIYDNVASGYRLNGDPRSKIDCGKSRDAVSKTRRFGMKSKDNLQKPGTSFPAANNNDFASRGRWRWIPKCC